MLSVVIVGLIVRTLGDELHRGRERYALDSLHYLYSQLYMAMEAAEENGTPVKVSDFPFIGPGEIPHGIDVDSASNLSTLLPEGVYVPKDPWDRAYVLRLVGRPDDRRAQVLSAGPSGVMPDDLEAAPTYSKPVHGPFVVDDA